ncbi:hypothetical protein COCON_G00216050 [Conger conger]|uniref:Uncharacterized protein n=1 Tax=Conger conger TaxID=82655 RepID=A0A9Q1CXV4_CONCO|nr:hypothetical protein COCON_G00216050 [Conger conger]
MLGDVFLPAAYEARGCPRRLSVPDNQGRVEQAKQNGRRRITPEGPCDCVSGAEAVTVGVRGGFGERSASAARFGLPRSPQRRHYSLPRPEPAPARPPPSLHLPISTLRSGILGPAPSDPSHPHPHPAGWETAAGTKRRGLESSPQGAPAVRCGDQQVKCHPWHTDAAPHGWGFRGTPACHRFEMLVLVMSPRGCLSLVRSCPRTPGPVFPVPALCCVGPPVCTGVLRLIWPARCVEDAEGVEIPLGALHSCRPVQSGCGDASLYFLAVTHFLPGRGRAPSLTPGGGFCGLGAAHGRRWTQTSGV